MKKLFIWAFMLRTDMELIQLNSINNYAIGESNGYYTNAIPMFSKIINARKAYELTGIQVKTSRTGDKARNNKWQDLYDFLNKI